MLHKSSEKQDAAVINDDNPPKQNIELTEIVIQPPSTIPASTFSSSPLLVLAKQQQNSVNLHYLNEFNEEELSNLEKKYNQTRIQLDKLVGEYWKKFWVERGLNCLANSTNLLQMFFRAQTSSSGIQNVVNLVQPNAIVPDSVKTAVSYSTMPGTVVYALCSSPQKTAVTATLEFATRNPFYQRITNAIAHAKTNKTQAFRDSLSLTFHNSVLVIHYSTGAMSNVIPFIDYLRKLPAWQMWTIISAIQYFTQRFQSNYFDVSYYQGVDFWLNKANRPWLPREIYNGNYAIPIQILFQGLISAAGLRVFPNYYYIAVATAATFGNWIPLWLVIAASAVQAICVLYPTTYNHYMKDDEYINAILRQRIETNPQIIHLIQQCIDQNGCPSLTTVERDRLKQKFIGNVIKEIREMLNARMCKEHGCTYTLRKPSNAVMIGLQGAIGSYFGVEFLAPLAIALFGGPSLLMSVACGLLGAGIFGRLLYNAEDTREINHQVAEHLKATEKKEDLSKNVGTVNKRYQRVAEGISIGLTTINAFSATTTTIGSMQKLNIKTPLFNTFISTTAIQSGVNNIIYNLNKVTNVVLNLLPSRTNTPAKPSATPGTLFSSRSPTIPSTERWYSRLYCGRRSR